MSTTRELRGNLLMLKQHGVSISLFVSSVRSGAMARPLSISKAPNRKDVAMTLSLSAESSRSIHLACLALPKFSLRPKPLSWKCNETAGLLPPTVGRLQMVETDLWKTTNGRDGVQCSAGHFPSDGVCNLSDNLQQQGTLQQLRNARIIACLRASSSNLALDAARAALDGGLTVLEVTMNTPQAAEVIEALVREYPSAIIGAGTVLSAKEADLAKDAGARFLMSPVTVEEIICDHRNGRVVHIPGAMTPTEVIRAYNLGAPAVKLYPMSVLGGVPGFRALSKPLGHIPMIASNGISLDMVESYISAGAMAVILSEGIFEKSALEKNDMGRVRKLAIAAILRTTSCPSNLIPI